MKLSFLFRQAIRCGLERDARPKGSVHAFEDTAILYGNPASEIKRIMVGIDIEGGELLVADRLRRTQGLDLVIAHHPEGSALAAFYEVMHLQVRVLEKLGVGAKVAQELIALRMQEVERRIISGNHMRAVDIARLLDIPFICLHTPADNQVAFFLQQLLDRRRPKTVQAIIDILMQLPEYAAAAKNQAGPRIILGAPQRPTGKVYVEMTGGTEGPKDVFDKLYKAGVRTLVSMHLSEEHFKKVKDANLNAVLAGHISSDTLGLNLLLDRIESLAGEKLHTIDCSGFRRIRRKQ
jgi:putative NIF3 family GTP cyclohydrolase 1 type 2